MGKWYFLSNEGVQATVCCGHHFMRIYIYDENPSLATVSFMYITKFLVFGEHMSCYKMTF